MSAPTYSPLDDLLNAAAKRDLMVDVTFAPHGRRHWVSIYESGWSSLPEIQVERDTYAEAIADALAELQNLPRLKAIR